MSESHLLKEHAKAFVGEFKGQKVEFDDLCTTCESIVDGHWKEIAKSLTKMSPDHKARHRPKGKGE